MYNLVEKNPALDAAAVEACKPHARELAKVALDNGMHYKAAMRVFEIELIRVAMERTATVKKPQGSQSDAARMINMSQSHINAVVRNRAFLKITGPARAALLIQKGK